MIVFGSTGSIGRNTLALAQKFKLKIRALSCGENIPLLNEQIEKFKPEFVCISQKADKSALKFDKNRTFVGQSGLEELLQSCDDELVVNAIVGFAGLRASLKTKELGKKLALANKESLVVAGKFLKGAKITPIDSEHSALNFLLKGRKNEISKLFITASGGAFFKFKLKDLACVTPAMALKHPNWSMGNKITIDSATMANKLFEIIEAYHLFDFKDIDALIEPKSLIHALCQFKDGGTSAYFSKTDMKLAISQAIFEKNTRQITQNLDFVTISSLKLHKISVKKYPIFSLKSALLDNADLGVLINAANEVMVQRFLNGKCGFLDIAGGIFDTLNHFGEPKIKALEQVFEFDTKVKEFLKGVR